MPTLRNPGALLDDAYEAAGFAPGNRHASRLAGRPEVARRIDELLAARDDARVAGAHAVIGALLRLAEAASALAAPRPSARRAWRSSRPGS
jgi:hypothetical protein